MESFSEVLYGSDRTADVKGEEIVSQLTTLQRSGAVHLSLLNRRHYRLRSSSGKFLSETKIRSSLFVCGRRYVKTRCAPVRAIRVEY